MSRRELKGGLLRGKVGHRGDATDLSGPALHLVLDLGSGMKMVFAVFVALKVSLGEKSACVDTNGVRCYEACDVSATLPAGPDQCNRPMLVDLCYHEVEPGVYLPLGPTISRQAVKAVAGDVQGFGVVRGQGLPKQSRCLDVVFSKRDRHVPFTSCAPGKLFP